MKNETLSKKQTYTRGFMDGRRAMIEFLISEGYISIKDIVMLFDKEFKVYNEIKK